MIHSGACDFPKACGIILVLWLNIGLIGFHRAAQETQSAHRYSMSISRVRFCCRMIST